MKRLLIVDDEDLYLSSLAFALQKHFEITAARSMAEAIERMNNEFDLALIDINLNEGLEGNIDGMELLEWIITNRPRLIVFMISGYREFSYSERAISLGARHFFRKPFDIVSLIAILQEKS